MTLAPILSNADLPAETPRERADPAEPDFESALMEGLSEPVSASSEDAESTDLPDVVSLAAVSAEPECENDEPENSGSETDFETMLLDGLSDMPSVSSEEAETPALQPEDERLAEPDPDPVSEPEDPPTGSAADFEDALLAGLSGEAAMSPENGDSPEPPDPGILPSPPPDSGPLLDVDLDEALMEGLPNGPSTSSKEQVSPDLPGAAAAMPDASLAEPEPDTAALSDTDNLANELIGGLSDDIEASSVHDDSPSLPEAPQSGGDASRSFPVEHSRSPDDLPESSIGIDSRDELHEHPPAGATSDGPVAALAFAADSVTETALREGLLHFEGASPDHEDPQVWPGGLRAAVAALTDGHSTGLIIVDLDGVPFPAGAMHELAEVCEEGTAVIALGSDGSARASREILLAGVSDYLVKPVSPAAIRDAALRAAGADTDSPARGCVAGFAGTGGSGATTLAAAAALHAAGQGRYVSILDLNRTVSSMALLLDVEPAPGLDQLFEVAGRSLPDPGLLDGVRTERSERISVYAYRLGSTLPPVPSMPALDWLLSQLRHRSQLVLVDGLDDPGTYFDLLGEVDLRVLVVEPTASGAARAARTLDLLSPAAPVLLVQNHTRAFRPDAGTAMLNRAGIEAASDVVVPFDRSLPELAGRGWPGDRLPRGLRKPVAALSERLSMPMPAAPAALAAGG